ncbi:hypothetical protein [Fructilactobacillus sanfranciscensis]
MNVVTEGSGTLVCDNQEYKIETGMTFIMPTPIKNY